MPLGLALDSKKNKIDKDNVAKATVTKWYSPIIFVLWTNGSLRSCIDS